MSVRDDTHLMPPKPIQFARGTLKIIKSKKLNDEKKQKNFNAQVDKRASNPLVLGKIKKDKSLAKSFHFKDNYFDEHTSPGND